MCQQSMADFSSIKMMEWGSGDGSCNKSVVIASSNNAPFQGQQQVMCRGSDASGELYSYGRYLLSSKLKTLILNQIISILCFLATRCKGKTMQSLCMLQWHTAEPEVQLHSVLTSALDRSGVLTSFRGCHTLCEKAHGTNRLGGSVGP